MDLFYPAEVAVFGRLLASLRLLLPLVYRRFSAHFLDTMEDYSYLVKMAEPGDENYWAPKDVSSSVTCISVLPC